MDENNENLISYASPVPRPSDEKYHDDSSAPVAASCTLSARKEDTSARVRIAPNLCGLAVEGGRMNQVLATLLPPVAPPSPLRTPPASSAPNSAGGPSPTQVAVLHLTEDGNIERERRQRGPGLQHGLRPAAGIGAVPEVSRASTVTGPSLDCRCQVSQLILTGF